MTTKIPAELSSTPGIVDNSNATAITIGSDETTTFANEVIIQESTSPTLKLDTTSAATSAAKLNLEGYRTAADIGSLAQINVINARDGDTHAALHIYASGDTNGYFRFNNTANTQIARLDADGLKFGTDSAAANALDDYEEGEHNPTITAGSGTPSIASAEDTLSYTKIGNKVFINGQLGACNASGCSGTLSLTMPFACAAQSERADFYFGTASSNNNDVVMFVLTNTANTNVFTIAVVEEDGTKNTSSAAFMSTKSPFDMNFTGFHYTTT